MTKSSNCRPDSVGAHHKRGHARSILGQRQGAVSDLKTAIELAEESGDNELIAELEQLIQNIEED